MSALRQQRRKRMPPISSKQNRPLRLSLEFYWSSPSSPQEFCFFSFRTVYDRRVERTGDNGGPASAVLRVSGLLLLNNIFSHRTKRGQQFLLFPRANLELVQTGNEIPD